MKKRILAVLLAFLVVAFSAPAAFADDSNDYTPPRLLGVSLDASAYNLGDTITVTVSAYEAESGFDLTRHTCWLTFLGYDPSDSSACVGELYVKMSQADVQNGQGVLTGSAKIAELMGGTYLLSSVILCDSDGNQSSYYDDYVDMPGSAGGVPDVSFELTSDYQLPDPTPPPDTGAIRSLKVSANSAKVGDTVTITIGTERDDVASITMGMEPTMVPWYYEGYDVPLLPVDDSPGAFSGEFKISPDMPQAQYFPFNVVIHWESGDTTSVYWPDDPRFGNITVKVKNPDKVITGNGTPLITSVTMLSGSEFVQGQKVSMSATLENYGVVFMFMQLCLINMDTCQVTGMGIQLDRQEDGTFFGTATVPLDLRHGHYAVGIGGYIALPNGDSGPVGAIPEMIGATPQAGVPGKCAQYLLGSEFTVDTALTISGADNETLLVGSPFDPMEGVSAESHFSGDITSSIEVTGGNIDTSAPGIFLVKYSVTADIPMDNGPNPFTYTDYRWIGVSEAPPDPDASAPGSAPLAVAKECLAVGAGGGQVSIQKDGASIPFTDHLADPGVYTLSSGAQGLAAAVAGATPAGGPNTISAVVDQTGPAALAAWRKTPGGILVSLKGSDCSGTSSIRYQTAQSAAPVDYTGAFLLPKTGKITVTLRDGLGNESTKVVSVNSSCSDSAYLRGVTLSAGALNKAFSPKVYSYKIALDENTPTVTLTPCAEWEGSVVTIGGKPLASVPVTVQNGKSQTVSVKVAFGSRSHTYTFTVTRAKSTDCAMKSLSTSAGAFDRAFDPAWKTYKLKLDKATKSVTLFAAADGPFAKITFTKKTFSLNPGKKITVKIVVTSQSGIKRTYTVTISRAK